VQIAPERSEPEGLYSDLLGAAMRLLAEVVRRLREIHGGGLEFNAWLHDGTHWHIELVPRTTQIAGLELGAGVWINSVAPEDAAAAFRRFDEP
jgi:galactose-1-phosphate uridylyltransferase